MSEQTKDAALTSTREEAVRAFSVETVQHLDGRELVVLQCILQHGDQLGVWDTPQEWLPPGRCTSVVSIDLRGRIAHFLSKFWPEQAAQDVVEYLLEHAVLLLTRYLVLLRMGPAGMGRKAHHRSLDPSSISRIAYSTAPTLFATGLARLLQHFQRQEDGGAHLPESQPTELMLLMPLEIGDFPGLNRRARESVLAECKRMRKLSDLGLWQDLPAITKPSTAEAMVGPARCNQAPPKKNSHLPLPDDYVAEMGRKSLWLIQELAPNLLVIADKLAKVWERTATSGLAPDTVEDKRADATREILSNHKWTDSEGVLFTAPPFSIGLPKARGFAAVESDESTDEAVRWPPRSYVDVRALLGVVQTSHYFVAGLSMGPRQSEALSLQRTCIAYAEDDRAYANSKTYKLKERHDGEWRDWLLPDAAVDAIEQQVRLVSVGERIATIGLEDASKPRRAQKITTNGSHLWAQFSGSTSSDATQPLRDINKALTSYARVLQMEVAPGGQNLRSHRFRKTLARLVALALTYAPKLLMDVFGHESIEMTLYYILTDKALRAEIETVSRELRVMRAKEVVEKMVEADVAPEVDVSANLGGYGGLAAVSIHNAIESHRQRIHRRGEDWGAESAIELAELLTLQGKAWEQVRHGVLCTKFPGEAGPCNKSKGRPEPSKCQSSCTHRLDEAFLREDIDGAIHDSVAAYEKAIADEESLTAAHWAGQIRTHVPRFRDLQEKWMAHPTVSALMANEDAGVVA
ncbi:hypothetical protein [Ralstonia solanacearum]|uniref:hypothetical protein n=2 Tax=Ralstonia solanacearum TaxID=305 RepID=UPI0012D7A670|nr:hypothetical protein [Ralstonia solanacearum]